LLRGYVQIFQLVGVADYHFVEILAAWNGLDEVSLDVDAGFGLKLVGGNVRLFQFLVCAH